MYIRKYPLLIILSFVLLTSFCIHSIGYAEQPRISHESIDFLSKTEVLTKAGEAMAAIAESVKPAIVNVSTIKTEKLSETQLNPMFNDPFFRRFFGDRFRHPEAPREHKSMSLGSGVIISSDGYIMTNTHVVKDADKIKVTLSDKREFAGKVIGNDPKTEISVIKIDATDLPTIPMGDSDQLKVGELVLAIGNPFGLNQTVTMGIVSAVGRANVGIAEYEDFIQTDAAINPGNSGGALINARGKLVGINTAIFSTTGGFQGIGFAIPSNMAKAVMKSLIEIGKVIRGWFGVSIQAITPELAKQFQLKQDYGTLVADVVEGSPAERAGIKRGDVIVEFDGKEIKEPFQLRNMVAGTKPGDTKEVKIIRDGKAMTLEVTIGELPSETEKAPTAYDNALNGVEVQNLTPEIYRELNIPSKIRGVVVTNIESGSAAESTLIPGDVIIEIDRKSVTNTDEYENIVSQIKTGKVITILIFRKGATLFVTIGGE